jgi:transcriptional regulator with XRE-family HTH domain
MAFSELIRDARTRDDYWIEDAILKFTIRLHQRMQEQGISKTELARRLGVSQPYITRVLKGSDNLTVGTMVKLARAVGASLQISLQESKAESQPAEESPLRASR